jgi:hypothetical protein
VLLDAVPFVERDPGGVERELGWCEWIHLRAPPAGHEPIEARNLQRVCTSFVTSSPQPNGQLDQALAAIVAEARAQVAAGRAPNVEGLEARIAAVARAGADARSVEHTRRALQSIASVHRARQRLAREPAPPPAQPPARRPAALRTKPTISGTLDVRRAPDGFRLVWDPVAAVSEWEVRFSERPDARSDYVERETLVLGARETSVEVPLGDNPLRVNILGRGRGRLQRRALISGLTRDGWRDRWQRRASAS